MNFKNIDTQELATVWSIFKLKREACVDFGPPDPSYLTVRDREMLIDELLRRMKKIRYYVYQLTGE